MTTEEKAKAYDEALERCKKVHLDCTDEERKVADYIFPQLAESEEERIRKNLIELLLDTPAQDIIGHHLETSKVLAYLEKQKEQKPVHTAKEMWKEMRLEVYAQASGNRHEPNYSDDSTKMFSLCDIDEIFEKIGDSTVGSQPAEWSEEDEDKVDDICKLIERATIIPRSGDDDTGIPPTRLNDNYKGELKAFVKSLRPQPHWKPSEEQPEADLDAEIKKMLNSDNYKRHIKPSPYVIDVINYTARHFYELGLNARKEE